MSEEEDLIKNHTKNAVVEVIEDETAEVGIRTAAIVRAKYDAYKKVNDNLTAFIEEQSETLGDFADRPHIMVAMAKLCFDWALQTEGFITANEDLLRGLGVKVRERFTEEAFQNFPEDIREELVSALREKRQEVAMWLGDKLREAKAKVATREKVSGE